jgi:ribosomal protein S12 methylthiotransferase accessory factor
MLDAGFRAIARAADLLVDPTVGVIRFVAEQPVEAGHPRFFHYAAQACDTGAFRAQANFARAGGAAATRELALAKAIGEAVERYCAAFHEPDRLPLEPFTRLHGSAVSPEAFAPYPEQRYGSPGFPLQPFTPDTPARWTRLRDPLDHADVWVPAAAVYLPYAFAGAPDEPPVMQTVSTGLACHRSPHDAALSGLCEVLERDAFMLVWQARLSPPQIDPASLPARHLDLIGRLERAGHAVTLLDITPDHGVPCVLALCTHDAPSQPALVVAAAASPSPAAAAASALEELPHTARYVRQMKATGTPVPATADAVAEQAHHLLYWSDTERRADAAFLWAARARRRLADLPDLSGGGPRAELTRMCRRVAEIGHRTLFAELTTPDVANAGLAVMRALVPGLQPLCFGHALRPSAGPRLRRVPQALGYPAMVEENPLPHPYP